MINFNEDHPLITVLTVCLNPGPCFEESIISVVNQSYKNIEYVIIDGGSKDGTLKLVEKYKSRVNVFISEKDDGIYDAINKGLKYANGDFLIVLGSDDHFLSYHSLKQVIPFLRSKNIIYYGDVYMEACNVLHKGKFNRYKRAIHNYCHQAIFYPKLCYKKYNYNTLFRLYSDNEYNFRVSKEFEFQYINKCISFYSDNGLSSCGVDESWSIVEKKYVLKYCGLLPYIYRLLRDCKIIKLLQQKL